MGIEQSREDTEPILQLLRHISHPVFKEARKKLIDFSRNKCKMSVSKWEVLLILQLNAAQVKKISQFLTGLPDPSQVDINSLFFILVLTNQVLSLMEKIEYVVGFMMFQNQEQTDSKQSMIGNLTIDEFVYIFQIAYQLLNRITDLHSRLNQVHQQTQNEEQIEEGQYESQAEHQLIESIFGTPGPNQIEDIDAKVVIAKLSSHIQVQKFFQIFQFGKVTESDLNMMIMGTGKASKQNFVNKKASNQANESNLNDQQKQDQSETQKPSIDKKIGSQKQSELFLQNDKEQSRNLDVNTQKLEGKANFLKSPIESINSKKLGQKLSQNFGKLKSQGRVRLTSSGKNQSNNTPYSISNPQTDIDKGEQCQNDAEILFGSVVSQKKSPNSLIKMSLRVQDLRNEQLLETQVYDTSGNLQKLQNNIEMLLNKNLQFYAQRQLTPFMRTLFSQKKAAAAFRGEGNKAIKIILNDKTLNTMTENGMDLAVAYAKRELRNTLDEYLQQAYSYLKYENAAAKARLYQFFCENSQCAGMGNNRGTKRILEQKKFKLLGQIQTLTSIFTSLIESNWDLELLSGDQIFQNIYVQVQNLYQSKIDHKFLLNFINLKSKKRESKRFFNYLEGVNDQLKDIIQNELLIINPDSTADSQMTSLYEDAALMIDNKLKQQKHDTFPNIIKNYQFNKIQIINYYTNLGKIKALYLMHQQNKQPILTVKEYLQNRIQNLKSKLEKVDLLLVDRIQYNLSKQKSYKHYFYSLGRLSTIKCGVKGFDFKHIFEYFALVIIKLRTQEMIALNLSWIQQSSAAQLESQDVNKENRITQENFQSLFKFQQIKRFDRYFGIGYTESQDQLMNFEKYQDDLKQLNASCDRIQKRLGRPVESSDINEKTKQTNYTTIEFIDQTTKQIIGQIYEGLLECSENYSMLEQFQDSGTIKKTFLYFDITNITNKTLYKSIGDLVKDFEKLREFIFYFVPFTEQGESPDSKYDSEEYDQEILQYMKQISTSFRNINHDEIRKHYFKQKRGAYKDNMGFYEKIRNFEENDYETHFKEQRDPVFIEGAKTLLKINKKNYLNGFNLKYLSLPTEHSIQHNYFAYQTLKSFLSEQAKQKIMCDIGLIAHSNEISSVNNQQQPASVAECNQDVINITQGTSSLGQGIDKTGSLNNLNVKSPSVKKFNQIFNDVFNLIENQDYIERKGRYSYLKGIILQLEYQQQIYAYQIAVYQDISNKMHEFDKDINKLKLYINKQIAVNIDEQALQSSYEMYERAFINHNKIQNQKQIEYILNGSKIYVSTLCDAFSKEYHAKSTSGQSIDLSNSTSLKFTELLEKLIRVITTIQTSLKEKSRIMQDDLLRQKTEVQKKGQQQTKSQVNNKKPVTNTSGRPNMNQANNVQSNSPQKTQKIGKAGDVNEQEMHENELKIINQIINLFQWQDLQISSKKFLFVQEVSNFIISKLDHINKKKIKVDTVIKFSEYVCADSSQKNQEENTIQKYQSKGSRIMNAVLSGNLVNFIDIYNMSQQINVTADKNKADNEEEEIDENKELCFRSGQMSDRSKDGYNEGQFQKQLSPNQKFLNYLVNFLLEICDQGDQLSSKRLLKDCKLFYFGQQTWVEFCSIRDNHQQRCNQMHAIQNLINIYEIQQTQVQRYLQSYEKHSKYVKKDLFLMLTNSDQCLLVSQFYEIMSKTATQFIKALTNQTDDLFCEVVLEGGDEKMEFSDAQTKIKRKLDQDMRTFKEFLDTEANKQLSSVYESAQKQQEIKLTHAVTALKLLVNIYYIKQIQMQEDLQFSSEQEMIIINSQNIDEDEQLQQQ